MWYNSPNVSDNVENAPALRDDSNEWHVAGGNRNWAKAGSGEDASLLPTPLPYPEKHQGAPISFDNCSDRPLRPVC